MTSPLEKKKKRKQTRRDTDVQGKCKPHLLSHAHFLNTSLVRLFVSVFLSAWSVLVRTLDTHSPMRSAWLKVCAACVSPFASPISS